MNETTAKGAVAKGDTSSLGERSAWGMGGWPVGTELSAGAAAEGLVAAIRGSAVVGLLTVSTDGTIEAWNTAATRIFGYEPGEAIGRPVSMLYAEGGRSGPERVLDALHREEISTFEAVHLRKDGSRLDVSISAAPVLNSAGEIVAGHLIIRDLSPQKQLQARLAAEHGVTRILSRARSLDEAAPLLLETIGRCLECEVGELWLRDTRADVLRRRHDVILDPKPELERFSRESATYEFAKGKGLPGRVWASRRLSWLSDLSRTAETTRAPLGRECGLRSGIAWPILRAPDDVLGVMTFFSSAQIDPDPFLLDMLGTLAAEIGLFAAHREVEDEREHLAAIVEASQDAIIGWTLCGTITSWNRGAQSMYGYTAEAAIGGSMLMLVPPDLHRQWREQAEAIKAGETLEQMETVRITKDGTRRDVSLTVSPIRNNRGEVVGAATIARDITEMKRSKELREMLVRELNHRLKNILSIVQALAMQSAGAGATVADFRNAFNDRLVALAEIYELVTHSNWQMVGLGEIVATAVRPYRDAVTTGGDEVTFAPEESITLGMVLHELTTNAVKYGALSAAEGRVDIGWRVAGDNGARVLQLAWTEAGGPRVSAPNQRGAGLDLIEHSISHRFGGRAVIDFHEQGVRWSLTIPHAG